MPTKSLSDPPARNMERLVASHLKGNQVRSTLQVGLMAWPTRGPAFWSHGEPCWLGSRGHPVGSDPSGHHVLVSLNPCAQRPSAWILLGCDLGHSQNVPSRQFASKISRVGSQVLNSPLLMLKSHGFRGQNNRQVTLDAGSFLLLPYCLGSGPVAITGGPEAVPGFWPWAGYPHSWLVYGENHGKSQ